MTQSSTRRYSGQLPEERDASRRARLLAAAKHQFGSQGFAGTSVDRICSAAKVSTRSFYELFGNKEAIFLAVYDDITRRSIEAATRVLAETTGAPMRERIPAAVLAYVGPLIEDAEATRIAIVEIVGASRRIEEERLAFRELVVALVTAEGEAAVARGEITPRDFRFAAISLAGAANAVVYDWSRRPDAEPAEELERKLVDLALAIIAD